MRVRTIICLVLALAVLAAGFPGPAAAADREQPYEWVFAVYMAADNDLYGAALDDLGEMSAVPPLPGVAVAFLLDFPDDELDGAYYLDWGKRQPLPGWRRQEAEFNSGDGELLASFLRLVREYFPSRRYALVLWDHGDGWRPAEQGRGLRGVPGSGSVDREFGQTRPERRTEGLRGVCFDQSTGDLLEIPELRSALASSGLRPDLIGFDACLMGMVEVAYELKDTGTVMVASEELVPGSGWPYDDVLIWLGQNPQADPAAFGDAIVAAYAREYAGLAGPAPMMSAVDLRAMGEVRNRLDSLATALVEDFEKFAEQIVRATWDCDYFLSYLADYCDLYDFARLLAEYCSSSGIRTKAQALMNSVDEAVLSHAVAPSAYPPFHERSHGLAVWLPWGGEPAWGPYPVEAFQSLLEYYRDRLAFARVTLWDEFLARMILGQTPSVLRVVSTDPEYADLDVPVGKTIVLEFSERIRSGPGYGKIVLKDASGRGVSLKKRISGSKLSIDPARDLSYGTTYTLTVPLNAVKTTKGAYLDEDYYLVFQTEPPDTEPPAVEGTDPESGATDVSVRIKIRIDYSEQVFRGPKYSKIELRDADGKKVSLSIRIAEDVLELRPRKSLKPQTAYTLTVPAGAVKDKAGNAAGELVLSFTTGR